MVEPAIGLKYGRAPPQLPSLVMSPGNRRSRTAINTIKVVGVLALLKAVSFLFTHSTGVLGSAADSLVDIATTFLVLWAVLHAERPADADHPWGHGKAEGLAALLQSAFIALAGCGLIFETVRRGINDQASVQNHWLGIGVMAICSVVTVWWANHVGKVAKDTGSLALEADRHHHLADVLVNIAAIAGLLLSKLLDQTSWPDLVVGLAIALFILNTARKIFLEGIGNLMDKGLQPSEEAAVLNVISSFTPKIGGFHDLRTRRSGSDLFLELHLDLPRELSFVEAHDLSEDVAEKIERMIPRSSVTVHADPL